MRSLTLLALMFFAVAVNAQLPSTFNPKDQPSAPDYSNKSNWSALPFRKDAADVIPAGEEWVDDSLKNVDVFFIYPTIYTKGNTWCADVCDKKLNQQIDKKPIRYQASVFNASCRVYAPRYRQACLKAFSNKEVGYQALAFAYQDVKQAFQYYLDHYNNGRPIIIASHSQGTCLARELLKEFFDTTALRKQLVAAYVVGFAFDDTIYKNLKPCDYGTQTTCYVTWASFKTGYEPGTSPLYSTVCVNPVTWNRDTVAVDPSKSIGTLLLNFNREYEHACSTQIHNHFLWVNVDLPIVRSFKNLHIADYNLFWFDIRKNVKDRVEAFLKK